MLMKVKVSYYDKVLKREMIANEILDIRDENRMNELQMAGVAEFITPIVCESVPPVSEPSPEPH